MKVLVWCMLCLIWGTTWFFIKVGLQDLPPIGFSAARFILAALVLAVLIRLRKIPMPKTKPAWKIIALTGILQFSINYSSVFWGEQYIPSGLAAVLQSLSPVFGLLFASFYLPSERVTRGKSAAVFLGIIGVATIFVDQLQVHDIMAITSCATIICGTAAGAYASILIKAKASGIHPASLVFAQMICGMLPLILFALMSGESNPLWFDWTWRAILCVIYLAIVGTIIGFWLYYWLLSRIESTKAMMISLVTPLIAVIVGAVFLDEKLQPRAFFGGALILASIGLIVFSKNKQEFGLQKAFCSE